ncbi:MAG: hypothetical protein ACFFBC_13065 [Promethearchaeota archaeon]
MGSSKGLTIFALLIGLSGLGLSGYTILYALPESIPQQQSGVQNIWYKSYSPSMQVYNVEVIPLDLIMTVRVNPSESLHVLFTAEANIICNGVIEMLTVHISLNETKFASANIGADHDHKIWSRIMLQYSNLTISPGVYVISISAFSTTDLGNPNYLYDMALLAFTYK